MLKKKFLLAGKAAFLLLGITFLSFLLVYYSPGDPAVIALSKSGMKASEEVVEYDLDIYFFKLFLKDPSIHVVQRVTVPAWLDGDGGTFNAE